MCPQANNVLAMAKRADLNMQVQLSLQGSKDMSVMVGTAIDHLMDLVEKLQESESSQVAIPESCVQAITSSVKELDSERLTCHEDLEIETIEASKLRHKLTHFTHDIEAEIRGAVASARASNEAEIKRLQQLVEELNRAIARSDLKAKQKTAEKLSLEPEKERLELEYENIIASLNQSLADKASLQIHLNETRKKLKEAYEEIEDLEKALEELKAELIEARKQAADESARLQKAVVEVTEQVEDSREENEAKKSELDQCILNLQKREFSLQGKQAIIRQHHTAIKSMDKQIEKLREKMKIRIEENADLTKVGMDILEKSNAEISELTATSDELAEELSEVKEKLKLAREKSDQLTTERVKSYNENEIMMSLSTKESEEHAEVMKKLKFVEDDFSFVTKECVRLKQENMAVENALQNLKQEQTSSLEILRKELLDLEASLKLERKERALLQNRKDSLAREIADFRYTSSQDISSATSKMSAETERHRKFSEQGKQLKFDLKNDEAEIQTAQSKLHKAKVSFASTQKQLKETLTICQENVTGLELQIKVNKDRLSVEQPKHDAMEKEFTAKTAEYESVKKTVVELKNKKSTLEISIDRLQTQIEKLEAPMSSLRGRLKESKAASFEQMTSQAKEVKDREEKIYNVDKKLNRLYEENRRFVEAITDTENQNVDLTQRMEKIAEGKKQLADAIAYFSGEIEKTWKEDMEIVKKYCEKDSLVISDLQQIEEFTSARENMVRSIYSRLDKELEKLTGYLDRVAELRPSAEEIKPPA